MLEQESVPILNALKEYIKDDVTPFDVPGHKNRGNDNELKDCLGEEIFKYDVNSKINLDNLIKPTGVIKDAQKLMANAFGVDEALFLVNGTTIGIQSMIMSVCRPGEKLIIPRNVHKSVLNALILCGIIPVFIEPEISTEYGIFMNVTEDKMINIIRDNPDAKAVLVINPTYYGVTTNLEPIVYEAHKHNMLVLADEAHGSHFYFNDKYPAPAMRMGADMSCVSLHKTGGSLTQSSALLINSTKVDPKKVKATLNLLQTTSGSYLLMASLDVARKNLALTGEAKLDKVVDICVEGRKKINALDGYHVLDEQEITKYNMKSIDLSKLCICVKDTGLSGFEVVNLLRSECKIQMELGDMYNILAVISLDDTTQDLDKLVKALKYIRENHSKDTKLNFDFKSLSIPKTLLNPRDAFFSDKKYVNLKDAVNKISGDTIIVYPPGIPIVSIGEEINKEIADYIEDMFNQGVEIIGMVDDTIAIIE